ncbi:hypothetical protein D3C80_1839550 [compost metagenome]
MRKQHVILQKGAFRPWFTDEVRGVLGFVRRWEQDKIAVLINNSPNAYQLELNSIRSDKKVLTELLSGLTIRNAGKILVELEPFGCMLLY